MNISRVTLPNGKTVFLDEEGNPVKPGRQQAGTPAPRPKPTPPPAGYSFMRTPDVSPGTPGPVVLLHQSTGILVRQPDREAFEAALLAADGKPVQSEADLRAGVLWTPAPTDSAAPPSAAAASDASPSPSAPANAPAAPPAAPASDASPAPAPSLPAPTVAPTTSAPPWVAGLLSRVEALEAKLGTLAADVGALAASTSQAHAGHAGQLSGLSTAVSALQEDATSVLRQLAEISTAVGLIAETLPPLVVADPVTDVEIEDGA